MAKYIKTMIDEGGNTVYPRTRVNAVTLEDGVTKLDTKLDGLDTTDALKADKLMATNLVTNGDFSNGTTGWSSVHSASIVASNKLTNTGSGTDRYPRISQTIPTPYVSGNKIYVRAKLLVTNANCQSINTDLGGTTIGGDTLVPFTISNPTINQVYLASGISKLTNGTGNILFRLIHTYADNATASGKAMEVQYILVVDLTAIFGSGLEPSKEQIDRLLSIYPNSWFNGASEITNVKQIWNEKTDRVFATNLVVNGDFSNGTTGWTLQGGTAIVSNNIATLSGNTGTTATKTIGLQQVISDVPINNKVYIRFSLRNNSSIPASFMQLDAWNSTWGASITKRLLTSPTTGTWYTFSDIVTLAQNLYRFSVYMSFNIQAVDTVAIGDFKYAEIIDLTTIFGAGLEPSKEQIDRLLSVYPNSWFNGTSEFMKVKQVWNEKVDRLLATNLVTNGDFSNGTTGWYIGDSTIAVASNVLSITGTGTTSSPYAGQSIANGAVNTHKYYVKFKARVRNSLATLLRMRVFATSATDITVNTPVQDTWYYPSAVVTANANGTLQLYATSVYADAATANGKVMEVQYVLALDLTDIFGAGKEPNALQMDNILANFTNSWFNGMVELASILNILATKADKTQEAWIAPTLVNSWVDYDTSRVVRYMKDSMGFVHIKGAIKSGSLGTTAFNLPVGYRPPAPRGYALNSNNSTFGACYVNGTGDVIIVAGNTALMYLDAICFKAEA